VVEVPPPVVIVDVTVAHGPTGEQLEMVTVEVAGGRVGQDDPPVPGPTGVVSQVAMVTVEGGRGGGHVVQAGPPGAPQLDHEVMVTGGPLEHELGPPPPVVIVTVEGGRVEQPETPVPISALSISRKCSTPTSDGSCRGACGDGCG
jgi:hypothetical protein